MPIFWLWTAVVWTCQLCWLTVMFYLNWWLIIPNGSFMGKCKAEKPPYFYCLGLQIVQKLDFLWEQGKGKEILRKDKNFALKPKTSSDKVFNVTIALLVRNWGDWTFPLTKEFQPNSEFQLLKDSSAAINLYSTVLIVFNCFFLHGFPFPHLLKIPLTTFPRSGREVMAENHFSSFPHKIKKIVRKCL